MASRDYITCHALDTTIGRPAKNVKVELTLDHPSLASRDAPVLKATTNDDGRVTNWSSSPEDLVQQLALSKGEKLRWKLKFYTEDYYGAGNTFFPFVEISFYADPASGHFHVPLLLGPWSYTTYRGS